jgi:hypothetical protein
MAALPDAVNKFLDATKSKLDSLLLPKYGFSLCKIGISINLACRRCQ